MGYKNPIVCKEIYLPYHRDNISFDDYKKLTGIDILEIFDIKENSLSEGNLVRKPNCKYYIVVDSEHGYELDATQSYAIPNGVYELSAYISDTKDVIFKLYFVARVDTEKSTPLVLITDISLSNKTIVMATEL